MSEKRSLTPSRKSARSSALSEQASLASTQSSRYSQSTLRASRPASKADTLTAGPRRAVDGEKLELGDPRRPIVKPSLLTRAVGGDRLHTHHHNVEALWRCLLPGLDHKTTFVIRSSQRGTSCHYALVVAMPVQYAEEGHADRYTVKFLSPDKRAQIAPGEEREMSHHELAEAAYGPCSRLGPPFSHQTYFRIQRYEFQGPASGDKKDSSRKVKRFRFVYERHYRECVYETFHDPQWHWYTQLVAPEMMVPPDPSMTKQLDFIKEQPRARESMKSASLAPSDLKSPSLAPSSLKSPARSERSYRSSARSTFEGSIARSPTAKTSRPKSRRARIDVDDS